jgi:hypothetical protein
MENVRTTKSIKHFSNSEKAMLEPYINGSQKITFAKCEEISKITGREAVNIYQFVYRESKKVKNGTGKAKAKKRFNLEKVKTITRDKSVTTNTPTFKQGEFIIPVNSWEVRNNNGTTSLVLKFDKSI